MAEYKLEQETERIGLEKDAFGACTCWQFED